MTIHALEVIIDVFLFPLINIVIFGLIAIYLAGGAETKASQFVFLGMLLWQIIGITSYSVAVGSMWNIWSRNLSNMFIAPLSVKEYVTALFASGCIKAVLLLTFGMWLSAHFFGFQVLDVGLINLTLMFIVFALFGLALAIFTLGIIFRFGSRLAALSWSLPWLFQPFSAAFFPVADLPQALQLVAYSLPPTYAFEAVRFGLVDGGVHWGLFGVGLLLALIYCVAGTFFFIRFLEVSKDIGQFARNES
ncbi:MAG TPA: ABC transporter permease [Candidatus Paceibacterota bacterium]